MLKALEEQRQMSEAAALSFEERLGLLVDREWTERENRRLKLTEAGRIALEYADTIFRAGDELVSTFSGRRSAQRHVLREPKEMLLKVPAVKAESVGRLMRALANFEPATEGQKLQHGQNLHAFDQAVLATRLRVDAGHTALPGILWIVIFVGAVIALSSSFFFVVEDARLHGILVALLAAFMGLVIFMIFALDRPFQGDLGIGPEPYQLIYDQLIKPNA
jgi:hypothetical protein